MVSVGMSLVINAAGLFDRIVSVYAGAILPAVTPTFSAVDFSITAPFSENVVAEMESSFLEQSLSWQARHRPSLSHVLVNEPIPLVWYRDRNSFLSPHFPSPLRLC
jgi:hypothetical protein